MIHIFIYTVSQPQFKKVEIREKEHLKTKERDHDISKECRDQAMERERVREREEGRSESFTELIHMTTHSDLFFL
jgi:hypothetical protein